MTNDNSDQSEKPTGGQKKMKLSIKKPKMETEAPKEARSPTVGTPHPGGSASSVTPSGTGSDSKPKISLSMKDLTGKGTYASEQEVSQGPRLKLRTGVDTPTEATPVALPTPKVAELPPEKTVEPPPVPSMKVPKMEETTAPKEKVKISLSGLAGTAAPAKKEKVKVSLSGLATVAKPEETNKKVRVSLADLTTKSSQPDRTVPPPAVERPAPGPSQPLPKPILPLATPPESDPAEETEELSAPKENKGETVKDRMKQRQAEQKSPMTLILGAAACVALLMGLGVLGYLNFGQQPPPLAALSTNTPLVKIEASAVMPADLPDLQSTIAALNPQASPVIPKKKEEVVVKKPPEKEKVVAKEVKKASEPAPIPAPVPPSPPKSETVKKTEVVIAAPVPAKRGKEASKWFDRGIRYQKKKQWDSAIVAYNKAAELSPEDPDIYNNLGAVYANTKEYDKALEQYEKSLELDPKSVKTLNNAGVVHMQKEQWTDAENKFRRGMASDLDTPESYVNLSLMYKKSDRVDDSLAILNQTLTLFPKYDLAYYYLGQVYEQKKMLPEARMSYEQFIRFSQRKVLKEKVETYLNTKLR
ncbi:tetratricopeptide repeat protein [Deltaproteobacteria bacterium TL4]